MCTPMYTAALLRTAKTWKQPKCPLRDEQVKKMQCVYAIVILSHRENGVNAVCSNMGATRAHHTK